MVRLLDVILGAGCGLLIGSFFHRTFEYAWKRGYYLPGPLRPSELHPKLGDVPPFTAFRDLLVPLGHSRTWDSVSRSHVRAPPAGSRLAPLSGRVVGRVSSQRAGCFPPAPASHFLIPTTSITTLSPPNERCSRQALFGCGFAAMVIVCLQLN
jgi:hypothetical protein